MVFDKFRLITICIIMFFVIWIYCSIEYYNNFQKQTETTNAENYRMKLYNSACKISESACDRCAEMAMASHAYALDNSLNCLHAVINHANETITKSNAKWK
jgi:hypothetical protein